MTQHEREMLAQCHRLLVGEERDGRDGMVNILSGHDSTLHGTNESPGGIVAEVKTQREDIRDIKITLYGTAENPLGIANDVRKMKRWVGMACAVGSVCAGLLVVMEFLSKAAPAIKELLK